LDLSRLNSLTKSSTGDFFFLLLVVSFLDPTLDPSTREPSTLLESISLSGFSFLIPNKFVY